MHPPPLSSLSLPLSFTVYIEVAANGMFGAGSGGLIEPPNPKREFPLVLAELAVLNQGVYDLMMDLTLLYDMSKVQTLYFGDFLYPWSVKDSRGALFGITLSMFFQRFISVMSNYSSLRICRKTVQEHTRHCTLPMRL